jgi:hypothetical protein
MPSENVSDEQMDFLIIHHPDGTVNKMPLPTETETELKVGRELDNDVQLNDPRASRHHAKIRRASEEQLEIIDVGSANGTLLGAVLLELDKWHTFAPGQVVQIGDTRLVWEQAATSQSTVPMTPISGPKVSPPRAQGAKRSNSLFLWVMGVGFLVLVVGLAWLLFSLSQSAQPDAGSTNAGGGPPANIAQQTPQGAAASSETPASIPLAPAQPSVVIENVEFLPVISGALFDTKHVYLIVTVRVENLGDEPFIVSTNQFQARTSDGETLTEFGQQFVASEFKRLGVADRFENLRLGSGGSVSEELIFFLETRPYQLTLHFVPDDMEPIQVSLGTLAADQELSALLGTPTVEPTAALVAATTVTATTTTASETDETPIAAATITATSTITSTAPPPRADGIARTIPSSTLVGTIAFPAFNGTTYALYFGDVASGEANLWRNEASQPSFSNSGNRIAYHSWANTSRGLITSNLDHTNGFLVTAFLEDQLPTWSPDDSQILFLSRRTGTRQSELYKAPSNQERPEAQLILEGEYPTWNRTDIVVFKGWVTSGIGLRVASGELTDYKPLTDNDTDTSPSISPDGQRVAFMSQREDNWDIYLINIDGTDLTRLTTDEANDGLPTWSPDGRAIAFVSNRGGPWAVWAMTLRGTGIRQLFTMAGSPDGFVASEPTHDTTRGWAEERISWKK